MFGFGPGRIEELVVNLNYAIQDSSWLKLLAEYGLFGAVPFMIFYTYCLFRKSPDTLLSFLCLVQFLLLGGYLNAFYIQFFHLALVAWPKIVNIQDTESSNPSKQIGGHETSSPFPRGRRR